MKFEIINPSDRCFVEGDDFKTVCIAVIVLGDGKYGLRQVDGDLHMPPVIFAHGWFKDTFNQTEAEAISQIEPLSLLPIFKTVKLAGERSSLNDIAGLAEEYVKMLERCLP
ncbi:MAG: hypothetical protein ABIH42_08440 [Planctomycetota bacterium]